MSLPQLDIPSKTNGTCRYGIDALVPGMLYGKLVIPPMRYGATVQSVDDSEAKKIGGFVKAVVVEDKTATTSGWVVAVASSYEAAKLAAKALKVDWDKGPYANVSDQSIIDESRRLQKDGTEGFLFVKDGDFRRRDGQGRQGHRGRIPHQPQYPCAARADERARLPENGAWHVYTGNQFNTRTTIIAAAVAGARSQEHCHASALSWAAASDAGWSRTWWYRQSPRPKAVGKPVKLIYAREDDMQMDFTRPLTYQKVKVGLDASGNADCHGA